MSKHTKLLTIAVSAALTVTGGLVAAQSNTDTMSAHMRASRANGEDGISSSINPGRDIGSTNNSRPGSLPIPPVYTVSPQVSVTTESTTVSTIDTTSTVASNSTPEMAPAPAVVETPSYSAAPDTTVAASNSESTNALPPRADRN